MKLNWDLFYARVTFAELAQWSRPEVEENVTFSPLTQIDNEEAGIYVWASLLLIVVVRPLPK